MKDLKNIRQELDKIDWKIIELISQRMLLQPNVAEYKKENWLEIDQPEREKVLLSQKKEIAKKFWISEKLIWKLFTDLIEEWKKIQEKIIFWKNSKNSNKNDKINSWTLNKKKIVNSKKEIFFKERDIFFLYHWENIWFEQNWTWKDFLRPVIILKKFWNKSFLWVSLTTTEREWDFFFNFTFLKEWFKRKNTALLNQIKTFDLNRLKHKIWVIEERDFSLLKNKIKKLI